MRIVFGIYGYSKSSEPLQPWLTVREVAACLVRAGHDVHIVTDIDEGTALEGLRLHYVKSMRPSNAAEITRLLLTIAPDKVVVLSTPMNLSSSSWYKNVSCDLYAFLSYPFYSRAELLRALPELEGKDLFIYGKHALVPKMLWAKTLRRYFHGVIGQSQRTVSRVANTAGGVIESHVIRAGTDTGFWSPSITAKADMNVKLRFLYVGSAKAVRGFRILLKAFGALSGDGAELRVLARGATDGDMIAINRLLERYCGNRRQKVTVEGGWKDQESLREEIRAAGMVVLPFVLVPSELPVSVLECIACGTPVISTDIDGLPETIGEAGRIVRSGSMRALVVAMNEALTNPDSVTDMRRQCLNKYRQMQSWDAVGVAWRQLLAE